jgi:copper(I)-binding protein
MRRRSRALWFLAAIVVAATVTSCAQSDPNRAKRIADPSRGNSVNAAVGHIRLLATRIEAPVDDVHVTGNNTGLFVTLVNDGDQPDQLTAVTTKYASRVVQRDGDGPARDVVSVPLPAGAVVSMQYPGGRHLELVNADLKVQGGTFLPVSFRFRTAGVVHVNVFVDGFGHPTLSPPSSPSS